MKNSFCCLFFAVVFAAVPAAAVFADIETGGGSAAAGSDTADLLNAFNLASAGSQETSNGCTTNPTESNQQVVTELPPLPENVIQPVSYSNSYTPSTSRSTPPGTTPTNPTRSYPNPPPTGEAPPLQSSAVPEPGTWLIMGIGAVAMVPLLRRKLGVRNIETV